MRNIPRVGEVWRHFKNKEYRIITVAQHTETDEEHVVYTALYNGKDYVRPLDMFMSEVNIEKYPDAQQRYRFERIR